MSSSNERLVVFALSAVLSTALRFCTAAPARSKNLHKPPGPRCAAAVERPHAAEMYDAVTKGLCLDAKLEMTKSYSRDWLTRGRIRVALKRSDGAPVNTDIRTKLELLVKCAELCARHPHRAQRIEEQAKHEAMLFSGGAAQPKTKAAAGGDKGAAKAGKGGKKKGKKK